MKLRSLFRTARGSLTVRRDTVYLRKEVAMRCMATSMKDELDYISKAKIATKETENPPQEPQSNSTTQPQTQDVSQPSLQSFGVFTEDETSDINELINNFTAPALARALRERESTLHVAAQLAENGNFDQLVDLLQPFSKTSVDRRRFEKINVDLSKELTRRDLVLIQRVLHKMPRDVFQATQRRASVVIPLCNLNGVASVLFQRRSMQLRKHRGQVSFPGGMVEEGVDATIIQTSLREMEEEIGISPSKVEVLGILRCNWNEVASMTGISVTPVVGFIGELKDLKSLPINPDEVEELFCVPLQDLVDDSKWVVRSFSPPIFNGGPHPIWGLTGYLLERFAKDILQKVTSSGSTGGISSIE